MKKTTLLIMLILWDGAAAWGQTAPAPLIVNAPTAKNAPAVENQVVGAALKTDAEAAAILERHVEAIGGATGFAAIKAIDVQMESEVLGRTIRTRRIRDLAGNRSYQRQDGGTGIIETGFDGNRVWQKAAFFRGYLEASTPQAKAVMRSGVRLPGARLYDYKVSGKIFTRLPDEQLNGKNYLVIKSADTDTDVAGKETLIKYYFDPATFLLKQTITGNARTQTETFDDYRKMGGVTIAFASTVINPQVTMNSKIIELKFNQPVENSIFEYRETTPASSGGATAVGTIANSTANQTNGTAKIVSPRLEAAAELSEAARRETFERVWTKINDTFYDRNFNGVNWQAVHDRYLPLVKNVAKTDDYHQLLNQMVQELHLSHFKVVPPGSVATLGSGAADLATGELGLKFKWIEDQLLVAEVKKDSPAAAAHIKPGFAVARVNGKTAADLYAEYQKKNPGFQLRPEFARVRAVTGELAGKPGLTVNLELADAAGNPLKLELVRKAAAPGRQLEFESKILGENIGYIRFNLFFGDLLPKFKTALNELKNTKALIIDLRGNPGGAGDLAPALANLLSAAAGSLGSLQYRYQTIEYSFAGSGAAAYMGKIVLLTDEATGSTAEVFAGGLQANKRATVIGSRSAGAVLPSLIELLPTGGALQHVISNYHTPDKTMLEGRGVEPNIKINTSKQDLLAGRDQILEQAIKFVGVNNLVE